MLFRQTSLESTTFLVIDTHDIQKFRSFQCIVNDFHIYKRKRQYTIFLQPCFDNISLIEKSRLQFKLFKYEILPALGSTGLRDLYCVLECDRVHKARTVVSPQLINYYDGVDLGRRSHIIRVFWNGFISPQLEQTSESRLNDVLYLSGVILQASPS